jgi:ParB family chromosome partitioning protein
MTAASKVRNIPLNQLVLSPTNVRKTPATAAEDAALEASIRAKGLLQNLIVHALPIDGKGVYEVDAGGRRLKILQKLVLEGVIDADHPVPCLVREPAAAVETSLMENTIRAAMHPADEFVAMAELIDAGEAVEAVALRFGVSERHVRQRLRLGKLAPELLDAFRAGEISLEVVTAFTLGADHAAQLEDHKRRHRQPKTSIREDFAMNQYRVLFGAYVRMYAEHIIDAEDDQAAANRRSKNSRPESWI